MIQQSKYGLRAASLAALLTFASVCTAQTSTQVASPHPAGAAASTTLAAPATPATHVPSPAAITPTVSATTPVVKSDTAGEVQPGMAQSNPSPAPISPATPTQLTTPAVVPTQTTQTTPTTPTSPITPSTTSPSPTAKAAVASAGSLSEVSLVLLLVVGLIAVIAWLLRRLGMANNKPGTTIRIVSGVTLGNRERVLVLEVADQWIVVGVAPGSINTLATMPRQETAIGTTGLMPPSGKNFAIWLKQTLDRRNGIGVNQPSDNANGL